MDQAGGGGGGVGVVGDHDDGFAEFAIEAPEEAQNLRGAGCVEIAGGFIGEDHLRLGDDGPGDGHALLLTAGKLAGKMVEAIIEADELQGGGCVFAALFPAQRGEFQREFHVFKRGKNRDQVERLKDKPEVVIAPAGEIALAHSVGFFAHDQKAAIGGLVHAGDQVEQRAFAGARRTHEGDEFARRDRELHAVKGQDGGLPAVEFLRQMDGLDDGVRHGASFWWICLHSKSASSIGARVSSRRRLDRARDRLERAACRAIVTEAQVRAISPAPRGGEHRA